jgi:catechol 2,3-dioxygenase-like lactoylglutathione lyase family enzyme
MICREPERSADFYEAAFGFARSKEASSAGAGSAGLLDVPGATARAITLLLGEQEIALVAIEPPGRSYPAAVTGRSRLFQHFAIVVADMAAAYARLRKHAGWTTISTDGPQLLPASSGGVTAYKFRDPEGHPVELLAFPRDATPARWQKSSAAECLGIDHSAISIADTERSLEFYQRLGFRRTGGSNNRGPEQDKLDGLADARVEVTALAPPRCPTPHVELLCYRDNANGQPALPATNDVAATRLVMTVENEATLQALCAKSPAALLRPPVRFEDGAVRAMLRDPDGHLLILEVCDAGNPPP